MRKFHFSATEFTVSLSVLLFPASIAVAQKTVSNEWTWVMGSGHANSPGVYGKLGTPDAGNLPGGREFASSWTDKNGDLWLFGGCGFDAQDNDVYLNDLWKYDVSRNEWTWMGGPSTLQATCWNNQSAACGQSGVYGALGKPASQNLPGGRCDAMNWVDRSGNFWLLGGYGYDASEDRGDLNDLWEFEPSTNMWTWMGGSKTVGSKGGQPGIYGSQGTPAAANMPGGRESGMTWVDANGHLWLYGGMGFDAKGSYFPLNDEWEFNTSTREWTWVGGGSTRPASCTSGSSLACGPPVTYGSLGVSAANINPGGRTGSATWTDDNGNFWLFGGLGLASDPAYSQIELYDQYDLWKFNSSQNEWAWMGGNTTSICGGSSSNENLCGQDGAFGILGTPSLADYPASRGFAMTWTDAGGNFWLFGGDQSITTAGSGYAADNELWELDPSSGEWAQMAANRPSSWGTMGTPAPGNTPSGRLAAATWTDKSGNFWLFGGDGWPSNWPLPGALNDLFVYRPAAPPPVPSFGVSLPPNPITVIRNSTTAKIYVRAAGGFNSPVTLALSPGGVPGLTATFSPSVVTAPGTSTMTVNIGPGLFPYPPGYAMAITGTSGGITQSAPGLLEIENATLGIALGVNVWDILTSQAQSGSAPVYVIPSGGFFGMVNLSCSIVGSPKGLSCSLPSVNISQANETNQASTLTVVATASTPLGNYVATVTGRDAATGKFTATTNVEVMVTSAPFAALTPARLTFPATPQGTSAATQTFTLKNTGNAALSNVDISMSGINPGSFSQANTCATSLAPGTTCAITVTFRPATSGQLSASISIYDNASNSPQNVTLSGTGTAPAVTLTPASLTFPSTLINTTAPAKSFTLANTGTAPLSLTGAAIMIGGAGAGSFTQSNKCGTSLAAGANCLITVTFKPAAAGTQSAAVNIVDNAQGSPQAVPLTGTGTAPAVTLTPTSLAFASTKVNSSAATQKITLNNTGNGALMLSGAGLGISVTGANAKSFSQTNNCGVSVAAGGNCTITVGFKPTAAGTLVAVLSIADNATNTPQSVGLSGLGK